MNKVDLLLLIQELLALHYKDNLIVIVIICNIIIKIIVDFLKFLCVQCRYTPTEIVFNFLKCLSLRLRKIEVEEYCGWNDIWY